jgi:hypothetical protein
MLLAALAVLTLPKFTFWRGFRKALSNTTSLVLVGTPSGRQAKLVPQVVVAPVAGFALVPPSNCCVAPKADILPSNVSENVIAVERRPRTKREDILWDMELASPKRRARLIN